MSTFRFNAGTFAGIVAGGGLLAGCGASSTPASAVSCPSESTSVVRVADVSASGNTDQHFATINAMFSDAVAEAAFCPDVEAHLVVFASSAGDSRTVFDGAPRASGQNDRAQAHQLKVSVLPELLDQMSEAVSQAAADLGPGSDPLAGFDIVADYAVTHSDRLLDVQIMSDGVSTSSRLRLDHPLTDEDFAKANQIPVAAFSVDRLVMSGVGSTAAPPPPADFVAGLRMFWSTVCKRVASSCVVISEVAK